MGDDLLGTPDATGRLSILSRLVVQLNRWFAHVVDGVIVKSVEMAQVILGRRGTERAQLGDVAINYEPASFPPKHVTVARAAQKLEIEHLESVYTTAAVSEPAVPRGYRCCVPPRL